MKQSTHLVKDYILFLLTRKDYSTAELLEKSLKKNYDGIDIKQAISDLTQIGLINDVRMAENIIANYSGYKGKTWIKQKLMIKKIPYTTIEILLEETEDVNQANDTFKKKVMQKYSINNWYDLEIKTKQKILHYIARQGFPNPFEVLGTWIKNDNIGR
ncbi:MAG: regulatory protein RecX [candidate division SR1 bacterium]|nr:regulatory protein RecX [candidate division SR1 bacterium]